MLSKVKKAYQCLNLWSEENFKYVTVIGVASLASLLRCDAFKREAYEVVTLLWATPRVV